eukprot:SAG25_NODE_4806_length_747_cov_0.827160_2_plen_137_part_00
MVDSNESLLAEKVLGGIPQLTGIMWDKIKTFEDKLKGLDGAMSHKAGELQSEKMKKVFPLKQHIEGGLYTREIFMPRGSVVVSMIHKQDHPSFVLKGLVSYLDDKGVVSKLYLESNSSLDLVNNPSEVTTPKTLSL